MTKEQRWSFKTIFLLLVLACLALVVRLMPLDVEVLEALGSIAQPLEEMIYSSPCTLQPLCDSPFLTWRGRLACIIFRQPLRVGSQLHQEYALTRLSNIAPSIVLGQPSVDEVVHLVMQKLRRPNEPMVLHFAGDNGVGKSLLAQAISIAIGQRCRSARYSQLKACDYGDSTLEFTGSSYIGYSIEALRKFFVEKVVSHARKNPVGVVIINEFSSLTRHQASVLLPLLGRGTAFPEYPDVDLRGQLVILTTDLGKEGVTRGKKKDTIELLVRTEFRDLFSDLAASYVKTLVFFPLDIRVAEEIIELSVQRFSCSMGRVSGPTLTATPEAVSLILEEVKPDLHAENGRGVSMRVVTVLDTLFLRNQFTEKVLALLLHVNHAGELFLQPVANDSPDI